MIISVNKKDLVRFIFLLLVLFIIIRDIYSFIIFLKDDDFHKDENKGLGDKEDVGDLDVKQNLESKMEDIKISQNTLSNRTNLIINKKSENSNTSIDTINNKNEVKNFSFKK